MTGKDLIIYILQNDLENEDLFSDGRFLGLLTVEEMAAQLEVGAATILTWYDLGILDGVNIGGTIFFPKRRRRPKIDAVTEGNE